jgi:hypothetical protein
LPQAIVAEIDPFFGHRIAAGHAVLADQGHSVLKTPDPFTSSLYLLHIDIFLCFPPPS